jgi:hypothetical protein
MADEAVRGPAGLPVPGHQLVHEPPEPVAGGLVDVDLGDLADRLDDARRKRDAALAAERLAATAAGGPCDDCGVTWSTRWERGQQVGAWHPGPKGQRCHPCHLASREYRSEQLAPLLDQEYRERTCRELLRPLDPGEVDQWGPAYLAEAAGFRWFREVPDAKPGGRARFAYLDLPGMLARLKAPPAARPLLKGEQCPICGCDDAWQPTQVHHPALVDTTGLVAHAGWIEQQVLCRAHHGTAEDLDELAAATVGLLPRPGLAAELGVAWWADHLAAMPTRRRLRARVQARPWRQQETRAFAWWPSRADLLARAWRIAGPREGDWPRETEERWRDLAAMRQAQAAAGEPAEANPPGR